MNSSPKRFDKLTALRDFAPQAIAQENLARLQAIKAQFEQEFAPRLQQARAEGLAEGKKLGEEAARQQIKPVLEEFAAAMRGATAGVQNHLTQLEALSLELLSLYLPKLVGELAQQAPQQLMQHSLKQVLHQVQGAHLPTLRVAPAVEAEVKALCQSDGYQDSLAKLHILADPKMQPGDCRLEWETHGHEINLQQMLQQTLDALRAQAAAVQATPKVEPAPKE